MRDRRNLGLVTTLGVGLLISAALFWAHNSASAGVTVDGTTDQITASGGAIDLDDEDLNTTGTTTTGSLTISGLDCTGSANSGALTTDASGVVSCSDDDAGGSAPGTVFYGNWFPGANQTLYVLDNNRQSTIDWVCFPLPRAGTFKNLYVAPSTDPGDNDVTVTVYVDEDTSLTVTHDGNVNVTSTVSNTSDTVPASAGERFCFKGTSTGDPEGAYTFSVEFI